MQSFFLIPVVLVASVSTGFLVTNVIRFSYTNGCPRFEGGRLRRDGS
jgi:hypothetical protein